MIARAYTNILREDGYSLSHARKCEQVKQQIREHVALLDQCERDGYTLDEESQVLTLTHLDLHGIDLSGMKVRGVCFDQCNMQNARLLGTRMRECSMQYTDLSGAYFLWCELHTLRITHTILTGSHWYLKGRASWSNLECRGVRDLPTLLVGWRDDCRFPLPTPEEEMEAHSHKTERVAAVQGPTRQPVTEPIRRFPYNNRVQLI